MSTLVNKDNKERIGMPDFGTFKRISEGYPLRKIMDKLNIKSANDFVKFMELLLEQEVIPSDYDVLIKDGNATLSETSSWRYLKDKSGRVRDTTVSFTLRDYDDALRWTDYGLIIEEAHRDNLTIFTNEDFTNNHLDVIIGILLNSKSDEEAI